MTSNLESYQIENLTKRFGSGARAVTAVDGLDLRIAPGELLVLLGPSGCGKTTALRCLAGLEPASGGRIVFGDRVIFDADKRIDVPPERRNIGMVFQSYALWPHKTVRQNIAYPLKVRKLKQGIAEGWVDEVAKLVEVDPLLDRYPGQLSGGQQQRVALARGLVARPELMLFDEPLSNLDALLRGQVRNDLHALHQRIGFSGVYVTHDQAEAFALGDRVAVMRSGKLDQIGLPQEVFETPATEYVANFVGMTNTVRVTYDPTGWRSEDGLYHQVPLSPNEAGTVGIRFRSSSAHATHAESSGGSLRLSGLFIDAVYAGGRYEVNLSIGEMRVTATAEASTVRACQPGDRLTVEIPWSECAIFDEDGQRLEHGADQRVGGTVLARSQPAT
jgi:iron(III) transport system ATP-binding protein